MLGGRRWIDGLLVAAGASCLAAGWRLPGAALVAFGAVMPLLRWSGRRRGVADIEHLVTPELAEAHGQVVAAASLPGVPDSAAVVEAADDVLLETAAVLVGRPPRAAAQRRFVAAQVRALTATAAELRERHEAWTEARAELEVIHPSVMVPAGAEPRPARPSLLVGVLVVLMIPAFVAWDVGRLSAQAGVAFLDGVALRLRTVARVTWRAAAATVTAVLSPRRLWDRLRGALVEAATEAHHRVTAARLRLRLRLRRAGRARRLGLG